MEADIQTIDDTRSYESNHPINDLAADAVAASETQEIWTWTTVTDPAPLPRLRSLRKGRAS